MKQQSTPGMAGKSFDSSGFEGASLLLTLMLPEVSRTNTTRIILALATVKVGVTSSTSLGGLFVIPMKEKYLIPTYEVDVSGTLINQVRLKKATQFD